MGVGVNDGVTAHNVSHSVVLQKVKDCTSRSLAARSTICGLLSRPTLPLVILDPEPARDRADARD
jgi:hypothetical protein